MWKIERRKAPDFEIAMIEKINGSVRLRSILRRGGVLRACRSTRHRGGVLRVCHSIRHRRVLLRGIRLHSRRSFRRNLRRSFC